ncbi:MAG TPA: TIGR02677 family protein [Gemmatimonadaceae bacterium]|nr:TIGR02677 family protein [Gemmatimonadaceae bacterium]
MIDDGFDGIRTGGDSAPLASAPSVRVVRELPETRIRRLTETAYLDTERTPYYRVIMRYFLIQAEAQVTWVKADEILAHVRQVYDPSYDDVQRDRDLRVLTDKRNLLEVQDARGARTARDFKNRRPEYHIRADALRLERWVRTWEQAPSEGGSLDPSLLDRFWTRLSEIHRLLLEAERGGDYVQAERAEALWPLWEDALSYVTNLNANTTSFHQALAEARPTDITDLRAFDYYKNVLFTSMQGFISGLAERADRIRGRLADWNQDGHLERLRQHLVQHRRVRLVGASEVSEDVVRTSVDQDVRFVVAWFAPDGACDAVRRATRQAISMIGRHIGRLAEADTGTHSRALELRELACAFAAVADIATAHRLAAATFGAYWLRHYRAVPEARTMSNTLSAWQQPAFEFPVKKIRQGGQRGERESSGIDDQSARQAAMLEARARERAQEKALLDRIFSAGRVDVGALVNVPAQVRARLLVAIRECIASEDHASLAADGTHIMLYPPTSEALGSLQSEDGTLWTPRFHLVRHAAASAQPIASSLQTNSSGAAADEDTHNDGAIAERVSAPAEATPVVRRARDARETQTT